MNSPAKNIYVVAKREFTDYFTSPVAYVFLVIFLALCAFFTFQGAPIQGIGQTPFFDLNEASLASFFPLLPMMFLILVPAIGMRLWSQEKRTGTLELLLTLPITPTQAVLGKFFASWAFLLLALALTFPLWITASKLGSPDHSAIFCGYLGGGLMAGAYLAIGCMTSAMTRDQVVSFILSFTVCGLTFLAGFPPVVEALQDTLPNHIGFVDFLTSFSVVTHFEGFHQGVFYWRDFIFFVGVMVVTLTATVILVKQQQGTSLNDKLTGLLQVALVAVAMLLLNGVFASPSLKSDFTENKVHTLNQGTKNILDRLRADRIRGSHDTLEVAKVLEGIKDGKTAEVRALVNSKLKPDPNAFKMELRLYFTNSDEWGRSFKYVREYMKRLDGLLEQITTESGGDIVYTRVNPQPDTDEEELAQSANLYPIPINPEMHAYIGLTLTYGDRSDSISLLQLQRTQEGRIGITGLMPDEQWEYNIALAISQMLPQPDEKPVVGLMSPMKLAGGSTVPPHVMQMMMQQGRDTRSLQRPPWTIHSAINEVLGTDKVREVPYDSDSIPEDIDVLIVIHPKEDGTTDADKTKNAKRTQFAIDQFVLRGGKLLAFLDPAHAFEAGFTSAEASKSDLPLLLETWGLNFMENEVVVDKDLGKRLSEQWGGGLLPSALEVHHEFHNESEPVTKNLPPVEGLHFGAFMVLDDAPKSLTRTPLLFSSKNSILVTKSTNQWAFSQQGQEKFIEHQQDLMKKFQNALENKKSALKDQKGSSTPSFDGKEVLAMKVTGEFKTAFPNGHPDYENDANRTAPESLKAAKADSNPMVILIGDVDVIHNGMFGLTSSRGILNVRLFLRLVDYLTGDEDLLSIRTATKRARPLTELKKREEEALETYRAALEKAAEDEKKDMEDFEKTRKSIMDKARHSGRIIRTQMGDFAVADEKDRAELDKIDDQRKATEKEYKALVNTIKKNEKHARTNLHNRYKWMNILIVPAFTILLGMGVLIMRRARVMAR